MGLPSTPPDAKYFVVALSADTTLLQELPAVLEHRLGSIEEESSVEPWDYSPAYNLELGDNIKSKFLVFERLAPPDDLPTWKRTAIDLEEAFAETDQGGNLKRRVNLDPGYLTGSQVILASTKRYNNRVYLRNGIYGDLTLYFNGHRFAPVTKMTFPEYRTPQAIKFFNRLRHRYLKQLKVGALQEEHR